MKLIPMSTLPETGFLRLPQIVGNSKTYPPIPALIPVSQKHLVGRGKIGPISSSGQARTAHHRLAGGRYPPPDPG